MPLTKGVNLQDANQALQGAETPITISLQAHPTQLISMLSGEDLPASPGNPSPDPVAPQFQVAGGSAPQLQGGQMQPGAAPLPQARLPYQQAIEQGGGANIGNRQLTKLGKLATFLLSAARGAAAGAGQRTVGGGFAAAQQADERQNQIQLQQAQVQQLPFLQQYQQQQMEMQPKMQQLQMENLRSEIDARDNKPGKTGASLLQDAQGNVVGWQDADKNPHSMSDPQTPQAIREIAASSENKVKPTTFSPEQQSFAKSLGKNPEALSWADWQKFNKEHKASVQVINNQGGGADGLSDEALNQLAIAFHSSGILPSVGFGKAAAALRVKIANQAAKLFPGTDLASNKAVYEANKSSLVQVTKMKNAVEAYSNTAGKNIELLLEQAKNVPDSGSPWLNTPLRSVSKNLMGQKEVPAYETARMVALTEIARVVNNPNLTGQLTDDARREVEKFNPNNATFAQTVAVARVLHQDMKNRHDALVAQEKEIRDEIGQQGGQRAGDGQKPGLKITRDANGRIVGVE